MHPTRRRGRGTRQARCADVELEVPARAEYVGLLRMVVSVARHPPAGTSTTSCSTTWRWPCPRRARWRCGRAKGRSPSSATRRTTRSSSTSAAAHRWCPTGGDDRRPAPAHAGAGRRGRRHDGRSGSVCCAVPSPPRAADAIGRCRRCRGAARGGAAARSRPPARAEPEPRRTRAATSSGFCGKLISESQRLSTIVGSNGSAADLSPVRQLETACRDVADRPLRRRSIRPLDDLVSAIHAAAQAVRQRDQPRHAEAAGLRQAGAGRHDEDHQLPHVALQVAAPTAPSSPGSGSPRRGLRAAAGGPARRRSPGRAARACASPAPPRPRGTRA